MHYLQLTLTAECAQAELISVALEEFDVLSVTVESATDEEKFDAALPGEPAWQLQQLVALFDAETDVNPILNCLRSYETQGDPTVSTLPEEDWERRWLEQFQPLLVGYRLWVVPSWLTPPDADATNLIIDPGLAFGTGTHPTTQLCLSYLSRMDLAGKEVVDYGCGSGILAIAALALGANRAIAADLDPRALDATRDNADANGVLDRLVVVKPDEIGSNLTNQSADLVIANILAGTLISLHEELVGLTNPDGNLLLSGILEQQGAEVESCYQAEFQFDQFQQQEWLLLAGKRKLVS